MSHDENAGYGGFTYDEQEYGNQLYDWNYNNPFKDSLPLPEYVEVHNAKSQLINEISKVKQFNTITTPCYNSIHSEKTSFIPLSDFNHRLSMLKQNAAQFTIQLGEGLASLNTDYLGRLKRVYIENEYLHNNETLNKQLGLSTPNDITKLKTVPKSYVVSNSTSMLAGVIEKIANSFRFSEFIIAANMVIIDFNHNMFKIKNTFTRIHNIKGFLDNEYPETLDELSFLYSDLQIYITRCYLNNDGTINFDSLLYGLDSEKIDNIYKAYRAIKLILNTSYNEIKIKTKVEKMFLVNVTIPSKYVVIEQLPDPDEDPFGFFYPRTMDFMFEVV